MRLCVEAFVCKRVCVCDVTFLCDHVLVFPIYIFTSSRRPLTSSNAHIFVSSRHTSSHLHSFAYSSIFFDSRLIFIFIYLYIYIYIFLWDIFMFKENFTYYSLTYTSRYTSVRSRAIRRLAINRGWTIILLSYSLIRFQLPQLKTQLQHYKKYRFANPFLFV